MTEAELLDDLGRLLREGLAAVDQVDGNDADPRFAITARGRAVLDDDPDEESPQVSA